jgi:type VI secretion system secreted protein Hcp
MTRVHLLCAWVLTGAALAVTTDQTANADSPAVATQAAAAASHKSAAFLRLDGLPGLSTDKTHSGWIQVSSFQWGVCRSTAAASGAGAGKAAISEIVVTKTQDSASPKLMQACANGSHFKPVTLDLARPDKQAYYLITLTDVVISGYATSSGGDRPTESFTLNFSKVEVKYTPQLADGTRGAVQDVPSGWDLKRDATL